LVWFLLLLHPLCHLQHPPSEFANVHRIHLTFTDILQHPLDSQSPTLPPTSNKPAHIHTLNYTGIK
jgi:hypothetical protein